MVQYNNGYCLMQTAEKRVETMAYIKWLHNTDE